MDGSEILHADKLLQYGALGLCLVLIAVLFAVIVLFVRAFLENQKVLTVVTKALGRNTQVLEAVLNERDTCRDTIAGLKSALQSAAGEMKRHGCVVGEILDQRECNEHQQAAASLRPA